jgi:hypothetical protein
LYYLLDDPAYVLASYLMYISMVVCNMTLCGYLNPRLRLLASVAIVQFGLVQTLILLNLELNLPEPVQEVRFRFSGGSNPELNLKKS